MSISSGGFGGDKGRPKRKKAALLGAAFSKTLLN
jgi:hypothetical protein